MTIERIRETAPGKRGTSREVPCDVANGSEQAPRHARAAGEGHEAPTETFKTFLEQERNDQSRHAEQATKQATYRAFLEQRERDVGVEKLSCNSNGDRDNEVHDMKALGPTKARCRTGGEDEIRLKSNIVERKRKNENIGYDHEKNNDTKERSKNKDLRQAQCREFLAKDLNDKKEKKELVGVEEGSQASLEEPSADKNDVKKDLINNEGLSEQKTSMVKERGYIFWKRHLIKAPAEWEGRKVHVGLSDKPHIAVISDLEERGKILMRASLDKTLFQRTVNDSGHFSVKGAQYYVNMHSLRNNSIWIRETKDEINAFKDIDETQNLFKMPRKLPKLGLGLDEQRRIKKNILKKELVSHFGPEFDKESFKPPTLKELKLACPQLVKDMKRLKLPYNDLLKDLGVKVNKDDKKYHKYTHDARGKEISQGERDNRISNRFSEMINDTGFRSAVGLKSGENPSWRQFRGYSDEYSQFLRFTRARGYKFNDLVERAGFEPFVGKWIKEFDLDSRGLPLTREQSFQKMVEYYKSLHAPDVERMLGLGKNEGVPGEATHTIEGGKGLLMALSTRGVLYNDVVTAAGKIPHEFSEGVTIGKQFHDIAEKLTLEHLDQFNVNCTHESISIKDSNRITDLNITLDERATRVSPQIYALVEKKRWNAMIVDFMVGASPARIKEKLERGYQARDRLLIIVSTHVDGERKACSSHPHASSTRIMGTSEFSRLVNFNDETRNRFEEGATLARQATCADTTARARLASIARTYHEDLRKRYEARKAVKRAARSRLP